MLSVITERRDRRPDGLHVPRILVVDDESMIVDFIIRALSRTGEYGLIITNLVMPDLDGYAMLTRLLRERPEQPVLVPSCLADVTTKVRCLELGAQDYLSRPFCLDELVARGSRRCAVRDTSSRCSKFGFMLGRSAVTIWARRLRGASPATKIASGAAAARRGRHRHLLRASPRIGG